MYYFLPVAACFIFSSTTCIFLSYRYQTIDMVSRLIITITSRALNSYLNLLNKPEKTDMAQICHRGKR